MLKLQITATTSKKAPIDRQILKKLLQKATKILNPPAGTVSLVFVDNAAIQALNKKWRQKDAPTDVLAFAHLEKGVFPQGAEGDENIIGEIFISLERASAQASEYQHSLQDEVNKLFIHGFLHLLGFTHDKEKDFLAMNFWEKKIVNGL